jgi:hypothetical protein
MLKSDTILRNRKTGYWIPTCSCASIRVTTSVQEYDDMRNLNQEQRDE